MVILENIFLVKSDEFNNKVLNLYLEKQLLSFLREAVLLTFFKPNPFTQRILEINDTTAGRGSVKTSSSPDGLHRCHTVRV